MSKSSLSSETLRIAHKPEGALTSFIMICKSQSFNNCRAITSRWISLVPSPMVHSFTSR